MDKIKNLTNAELSNLLRKNDIHHGPVVDSTRTLYEKKLLEFERREAEETYNSSYKPQAHHRKREDQRKIGGNTYQDVSHSHDEEPYSEEVEPRRPIRPKQPAQVQSTRRFIPLWMQMLLLLLFTAFLLYLYFRDSHQDPIQFLMSRLPK